MDLLPAFAGVTLRVMEYVDRIAVAVDPLGREVGRWNSTGNAYVVINGRRFEYRSTQSLDRYAVRDVYVEPFHGRTRVRRVLRGGGGIFG